MNYGAHGVVTMKDAVASGVSSRKVYRLVARGEWQQLYPSVFLTHPRGDAKTDDERTAQWKSALAGLVAYAGPGAMVSHRSAAKLYGLEGLDGHPLDVTVPNNSRRLLAGVHRTRIADPKASLVDGFLVTSLARTLRDLGIFCSADVLEQAIESVLRGPDPWKPDEWKEHLLVELREVVATDARLPGLFVLRTALSRRSDDDRPTGSFPETLLFQAARSLGLPMVRQVTLRIIDENGFILDIFFPDFFLPEYRLLVEVDSSEAHSGGAALQRDLRRQNKVVKGFWILRFTANEVLADPIGVAERIRRATANVAPTGPTWRVHDVSVSYSPNLLVLVDHSRNAREEALLRRRR